MLGQYKGLNKHRVSGFFLGAVLIGVFFFQGVSMGADAKTADIVMVPESFSSLAEMVSPAVVNVRTEKTVQAGGRNLRQFVKIPLGMTIGSMIFLRNFLANSFPKTIKSEAWAPVSLSTRMVLSLPTIM